MQHRIEGSGTHLESQYPHLLDDLNAVHLALRGAPQRVQLDESALEFAVDHCRLSISNSDIDDRTPVGRLSRGPQPGSFHNFITVRRTVFSSSSARSPLKSASGVGGQPLMCRSTGITAETPPATA